MVAISHGGGGGGSVIDERLFNYDRCQNKTLRAQTESYDLEGTTTTNVWEHDALTRTRLAINAKGTSALRIAYVLDSKGSRVTVTNDTAAELYVRDATLPSPADFQMDQYTATPYGSNTYDSAGRLVEQASPVSTLTYSYDYAGRLVEVSTPGAGGLPEPLAGFGYDAFGRRVSKTVYGSGIPPETTLYVCDGVDDDCDGMAEDDDILETYQNGTRTSIRVFCDHACGSGGRVSMDTVPVVIINDADVPLFTRCDELGNVLALTDSSGAVLERCDYSDFGEPQFLTADGRPLVNAFGEPVTASPAGNPYLIHGMQWDGETGLYLDQSLGRYVDPRCGQYTSRSDSCFDWELHSRAFSDNNP